MAKFEFEFNERDRKLILSQASSDLNDTKDYIRLTIYNNNVKSVATNRNTIVTLPNNDNGIDGRAIFFSTDSETPFTINISPFTSDRRFASKIIGSSMDDFKLYRDVEENIYIKPNEIFNTYGLPRGNYRIQIDFLNQFNQNGLSNLDTFENVDISPQYLSTLPFPQNFQEFNINENIHPAAGFQQIQSRDINSWTRFARPDISKWIYVLLTSIYPSGELDSFLSDEQVINQLSELNDTFYENEQDGPYIYTNEQIELLLLVRNNILNSEENVFGMNTTWTWDGVWPPSIESIQPIENFIHPYVTEYLENENIDTKFIVKEISTSRKEVRLKVYESTLTRQSLEPSGLLYKLQEEFNRDENYVNTGKYQFKHILNIGTGDHIPIMNYAFDKVTDGRDNQSIVLKLYEPIPSAISKLTPITIEKEVLTTQVQEIFYFSDVDPLFYGGGLTADSQENWLNSNDNNNNFQNLNDLIYSSSISDDTSNSLISSSEYGYPNLNTDFNEFENHTFFGSAKKKLQNFSKKIETIQSYYSEISSSLSVSSTTIVKTRKDLFKKINDEINTFTPYEKFLYYDGQSESTSSAPGLGKNYSRTKPLYNKKIDNVFPYNDPREEGNAKYEQLNQTDGFKVVYKASTSGSNIGRNRINLTAGIYQVQDKPFFNYSGSVYLSFLLKGTSNLQIITRNNNHLDSGQFNSGMFLPKATKYTSSILEPVVTGSEYRRFIFQASQSYFVPNTVDNDVANISYDGNQAPTGWADASNFTVLHEDLKTGSSFIFDSSGLYPTTVVTQSGAPFKGSIMPAGDLFSIDISSGLGAVTTPLTQSFITDVKVTFEDPSNVLPFDNIYHTSSTEWTNWYNDMLTKAETFDTDNIHSFENNLPLYIQESSQYNDMKDFLKLQGEQYDLIRNHIDSMGTIHKRGYKKTDSPPNNTLPMLLSNMGWQAINPFTGSLTDTLGSYLTGVTTIDDIKNNTWRKTLNNLLYIYKSKGTKNSVRGLLNTYGYPPDVLGFQEFGGVTSEGVDGNPVFTDNPPSINNDLKLENQTGIFSFVSNKRKLYNYKINGLDNRVFSVDHYRGSGGKYSEETPVNTIEFIYKHVNSKNNQLILDKSSTVVSDTSAFDLTLLPSSAGSSSSFQFRLSTNANGSGDIATNAVSMSTPYLEFKQGQLWNIMLQRMTASSTYTDVNEYRLHVALQEKDNIKTYSYVTMSVSGSGAAGDKNTIANENWENTGSFSGLAAFGNLFLGGRDIPGVAASQEISGSISEIRGWSTALSTSKFRQHVLNKFSTIGNSIDSHKDELVYHFKLNENYSSASVSASGQNLNIVDSSPTTTYSDYSITIDGGFFTSSIIYGFDYVDSFKQTLQDNNNEVNNNDIIISPNYRIISDLNSNSPSIESITNPISEKPQFNTSPKLEIYRSPQTFVDNFILDNLGGFNLETLYGNPLNYYSESYTEFDTFREKFFDAHQIKINSNKFIRAHENMFNESIIDGLKSVVPARSTFSDLNSNVGVELKPTILEKQKVSQESGSIEVNPNTLTGSHLVNINLSETIYDSVKEGTVQSAPSLIGSNEVPHNIEISLGNQYSESVGYIHPPFLQPGGYVTTIENPYDITLNISPTYDGSTVVLSKDGTFDYASILNKSYSDVHKNWGRTNSDVQHINFAAPTGSDGTFNTYAIETRFVFHTIGDNEYYSASNSSDFHVINNFYNRLYFTNDIHKNIKYISRTTDANYGTIKGRMMGKTRFFQSARNLFTGITTITLPRNHVTKFSQPFKEQMIDGTQNTNPGFLNVQHEDYSTASFYRVNVTGGENSIYVKGTNNPTKDSNDKIIY